MEPITTIVEVRTDDPESDQVKDVVTFVGMCKDGSQVVLPFTLEGARSLRDSLDCVPEIDGKEY